VVKYHHPTGSYQLLDKLETFRIIFPLNLYIVVEGLEFWGSLTELKTNCVKGRIVLSPEISISTGLASSS
jgi:hypothetical protein